MLQDHVAMMWPLVSAIKPAVRAVVPERWRRQIRLGLSKRWDVKFKGQPAEDVFAAIYKEKKWGAHPQADFYSGSGSHDPKIVLPYIEAVSSFLQSRPGLPPVVDLGCGDFNVGSPLRPYCGKYTACDVVPDLIRRNQKKFGDLDVDFRRLDITQGDLPHGDVAVLRQVLQHLSNGQILRIVPKLYRYSFLVLTEHLSDVDDFSPNLEKPTGAMVRVSSRSGIVLTQPPFDLKVKSEKIDLLTRQSRGSTPCADHNDAVRTVDCGFAIEHIRRFVARSTFFHCIEALCTSLE